MIQGAIFDLDGTILDSMSIWDTIGEDYLRSLGIEPKKDGFIVAAVYDVHENNQKDIKSISDFYIEDFSDVDIFLNSIRN